MESKRQKSMHSTLHITLQQVNQRFFMNIHKVSSRIRFTYTEDIGERTITTINFLFLVESVIVFVIVWKSCFFSRR